MPEILGDCPHNEELVCDVDGDGCILHDCDDCEIKIMRDLCR